MARALSLDADAGGAKASNNPRQMAHYTAIIHPFCAGDLRQDAKVQQAWSYSDINRIYNYEAGEFNGIRFCESNIVPFFTGFANNAGGMTYTPGTAGARCNLFARMSGSNRNRVRRKRSGDAAAHACGEHEVG